MSIPTALECLPPLIVGGQRALIWEKKRKSLQGKKKKKKGEGRQREGKKNKLKQFRQELSSTSIKYSSRFLRAWGADHIRREVLLPGPGVNSGASPLHGVMGKSLRGARGAAEEAAEPIWLPQGLSMHRHSKAICEGEMVCKDSRTPCGRMVSRASPPVFAQRCRAGGRLCAQNALR